MAYEEVVPQVWRGRGTPTAAAARRRATKCTRKLFLSAGLDLATRILDPVKFRARHAWHWCPFGAK